MSWLADSWVEPRSWECLVLKVQEKQWQVMRRPRQNVAAGPSLVGQGCSKRFVEREGPFW